MSAALRRLGRGARRIGRWVHGAHPLTLVALVALGAVVVTLAVRAGPAPPEPLPVDALPPRVGVSDGDRVAVYTETARTELDAIAGSDPTYALITLTTYLAPAEVADLLRAGDGELRPVFALARVPLPRRQTEIVRLAAQRVPDDVLAAMGEIAARKEHDARVATQRAGQEADPERRSLALSLGELSRSEAASYAAGCACVFALVVFADHTALAALATHDRVRVVDPAPEVTDVSRAVFVAPLPEHVDIVGPLPDDLTSSDGASAAVRSS
jgi:hypothetical protein